MYPDARERLEGNGRGLKGERTSWRLYIVKNNYCLGMEGEGVGFLVVVVTEDRVRGGLRGTWETLVCVCVCVCLHIFIYTHTHRHTNTA